jgi:outer membrane protein, multidrug efflux system
VPFHASNFPPAHKGRSQAAINSIANAARPAAAHAFIRRWLKAGDAQRRQIADTNAEEASQLARVRFDAGVTDFLVVLDAEREVLTNRDQLVQAQSDTATALVSVYRALGGGWNAPASQ